MNLMRPLSHAAILASALSALSACGQDSGHAQKTADGDLKSAIKDAKD
jgi:hypothetical protein